MLETVNSKNLEFFETRLQLPSNVSAHLLEYLDVQDFMWCGAVCRNWKRVLNYHFETIVFPKLPWKSDWIANQRPADNQTWFSLMHRWGTVLFNPSEFRVMGQPPSQIIRGFAVCDHHVLRWTFSSSQYQVFDSKTGAAGEIGSLSPPSLQMDRDLRGANWSGKFVVSSRVKEGLDWFRALEVVDPKECTASFYRLGRNEEVIRSSPSDEGWVAFVQGLRLNISFVNLGTGLLKRNVVTLLDKVDGLSIEQGGVNRLATTDNVLYALVSEAFQHSKIVGVRVDHSKKSTWDLLFKIDVQDAYNRGLTNMAQVWGNLLVKGSCLALHTHRSIRVFDSASGYLRYAIPTAARQKVFLHEETMVQKWYPYDNRGDRKDGVDQTIVRNFFHGGRELTSFTLPANCSGCFTVLDGPKLAQLIESTDGSFQVGVWNISSGRQLALFSVPGVAAGRDVAGLALERGALFLFKRSGEILVWHPESV